LGGAVGVHSPHRPKGTLEVTTPFNGTAADFESVPNELERAHDGLAARPLDRMDHTGVAARPMVRPSV
jgi:hypothetical protein